MAQLHWELCDALGAPLAGIESPLGARVTIGLNRVRQAQLAVSVEDPVVRDAYPLYRSLKCWYDHTLIFAGPLIRTPWNGSQRLVQLNALGPEWRLQQSYVNQRSDGAVLAPQTAIDQGEIMARLIEHVSPTAAETALGVRGHGITRGTLSPAVYQRTMTFESGKQIWAQLQDIASMDNGPDYEFEPVDRQDGVFAELNTYVPRQGNDLIDSIRFEYGVGINNCTDFGWDPAGDQVRNRFTFQGQAVESKEPKKWRADQQESQKQFGIIAGYEGASDLDDDPSLRALAVSRVAVSAWPPNLFTVVPAMEDGTGWAIGSSGVYEPAHEEFGIPPRFGPDSRHDYWIGDSIACIARDANMNLTLTGRVTDAEITQVGAAGDAVVALSCAPTLLAAGVVAS